MFLLNFFFKKHERFKIETGAYDRQEKKKKTEANSVQNYERGVQDNSQEWCIKTDNVHKRQNYSNKLSLEYTKNSWPSHAEDKCRQIQNNIKYRKINFIKDNQWFCFLKNIHYIILH